MANNAPTNKLPPVEEISPDGNPTGQFQSAPRSSKPQQQQQVQKPVQSMEDLQQVDEGQQQQQVEQQQQEPILDISAFLQAKGNSDEVIQQQQAQEKAEEEKNKQQQVQVVPQQQQNQQTQQTQQQQQNGRDYSDIDEADRELFKRMPNESFARLKPVYIEHKKAKAELENTKKALEEAKKGVVQVPDNYYSHPQAFMLTPEFNQAASNVNNYQQVYNHWEQQLKAVREGAKEIDFLGYNNVTGQFYTQKVPANVETEQQLISYAQFAQKNLINANAQLEVVRQTYGSKYQDSVNGVNNLRQQYFHQLQNNQQLEPIIQQHVNNLPAAFRTNPLARALAESLTMNQFLAQQLMNGKGGQQQQQKQQRRQGPSGEEIAGEGVVVNGGKEKKEDNVTVDDFEAVKQGL